MKLTDKTKKRLTIAGLGVVSIALVIAIASQFKADSPKDSEIQPTPIVSSEEKPSAVEPVSVPPSSGEPTEPTESKKPNEETETPTVNESKDTGKSAGTEQQIQAEPTKPPAPTEPPKPSKPKAETSSPQTVTKEPSKAPEHKTENKTKKSTQAPSGGEKKDGKIYVPGFGWVEDEGGGVEQKTVGNEDDQLTGNKVGSMD